MLHLLFISQEQASHICFSHKYSSLSSFASKVIGTFIFVRVLFYKYPHIAEGNNMLHVVLSFSTAGVTYLYLSQFKWFHCGENIIQNLLVKQNES
jgi:hypothetical protein